MFEGYCSRRDSKGKASCGLQWFDDFAQDFSQEATERNRRESSRIESRRIE